MMLLAFALFVVAGCLCLRIAGTITQRTTGGSETVLLLLSLGAPLIFVGVGGMVDVIASTGNVIVTTVVTIIIMGISWGGGVISQKKRM